MDELPLLITRIFIQASAVKSDVNCMDMVDPVPVIDSGESRNSGRENTNPRVSGQDLVAYGTVA